MLLMSLTYFVLLLQQRKFPVVGWWRIIWSELLTFSRHHVTNDVITTVSHLHSLDTIFNTLVGDENQIPAATGGHKCIIHCSIGRNRGANEWWTQKRWVRKSIKEPRYVFWLKLISSIFHWPLLGKRGNDGDLQSNRGSIHAVAAGDTNTGCWWEPRVRPEEPKMTKLLPGLFYIVQKTKRCWRSVQ